MKILVIGGTGNISTGIVNELLKGDNDITVLNRGSRMLDGVKNVICDRYNGIELACTAAKLGEFDCVFDMIAYDESHARDAVAAFSGRTAQMVFCSTVDTYIKPAAEYPVSENAPRGADKRFSYAYKKVLEEEIYENAASKKAFELTIVRPAATYFDESEPIGIFTGGFGVMRRIREHKPIIVMGDGMNLWTFSHRDDVGAAIAHAAGNKAAYGRSYTVCGDKAIPWISYYGALAEALGEPTPEYVYVPTDILLAADPAGCDWCELNFKYDNIYDTSAAKRDLDYKTTITWREGAERIVKNAVRTGKLDSAYVSPRYDRMIEYIKNIKINIAADV